MNRIAELMYVVNNFNYECIICSKGITDSRIRVTDNFNNKRYVSVSVCLECVGDEQDAIKLLEGKKI